jgi:hypothetical protein
MDGYYDRVEAQLRALTERGAHRRTRVWVTPIVAMAAAAAVVVVVAGVFLGVRGRSPSSPASPASACTRAEWRMTGIPARELDGATVAGVSITATTSCHLRVAIAFDLLNRSGAVAGAVGASVDSTIAPGGSVERRWAWRNACGEIGPFWFRLSGGGRSVRVPVSPPPCVNRRDTTAFGLFKLSSPDVLSGRGIAPVRFGTRFAPTLVAVSNLLGVFGDRTSRRGCGVATTEHMLDHNDLFFGHGRFVGYEYSGHFLTTTAGLRVGDTIARARQLYGAAFKTSAAQAGSWSAAGLRGYLTAPRNGRIATIDAGNVGCAALSP